MSWTSPPTYVTGQLMTAAIANAQWRDNENYLFDFTKNVVADLPHEFGGLAAWTVATNGTAYPAGATLDKLAPNTDVVAFDSANLPAGTYKLEAVLSIEGGATITCALVNLTDGAPDTAIVSITSTSATGQQVVSAAITFAAGGATKTYGIKIKTSDATKRMAAWGVRVVRTA